MESSWPSGARGAYVCFLSNPQNLDIGSLIARPRESPFALALRSSSMVLVLPNSKVSIHNGLLRQHKTRLQLLRITALAWELFMGVHSFKNLLEVVWKTWWEFLLLASNCIYVSTG